VSSAEALHDSVRLPTVVLVFCRFQGAVGASVSGQALVRPVTVALAERLPAASRLTTPRE
jgi:hypothetical protein